MPIGRYALTIALITVMLGAPACSTLSFHGEGSIDSNPPPSPPIPSSAIPAEEPGVEPHADPGPISDTKNIILEVIDENPLTHIPRDAPNESGP